MLSPRRAGCERGQVTCVVIGAGGGIGAALAEALEAGGRPVMRLGRGTTPPVDLLDEASIEACARTAGAGLELVIDATGFLHDARFQPEKSWRQLDAQALAYNFAINTIGPALLMKHFLPLLARDRRAVFATLSARVGSIGDNRLGGWYGYRAAKAALNQMVRTASIELARTHRQAVCVALHPGTVDTKLSRPFTKAGLEVRPPAVAAGQLIAVLHGLTVAQSGLFFDYEGKQVQF
jgi:NAD(P)-dependent dehydrogenase (short-subunit alcohol dehydrogenase family)